MRSEVVVVALLQLNNVEWKIKELLAKYWPRAFEGQGDSRVDLHKGKSPKSGFTGDIHSKRGSLSNFGSPLPVSLSLCGHSEYAMEIGLKHSRYRDSISDPGDRSGLDLAN